MNLDELMNNPMRTFDRLTSHEPKDGYFWKSFQFIEGGYYAEGDDLFRARIKETVARSTAQFHVPE